MNIIDLFEAVIKLGIPVAGLSWLLFYRLYSAGDLDRAADAKSIRQSLKRIKKEKSIIKQGDARWVALLGQNWMRFGGGFYGTAGLWTFIYIEAGDVIRFFSDFSQITQLINNGLINLVVSFFVNQFTNFITAIVWVTYWPDDTQSIFIWLAVAYLFYLLGVFLGRANETVSKRSWNNLKNRIGGSK